MSDREYMPGTPGARLDELVERRVNEILVKSDAADIRDLMGLAYRLGRIDKAREEELARSGRL